MQKGIRLVSRDALPAFCHYKKIPDFVPPERRHNRATRLGSCEQTVSHAAAFIRQGPSGYNGGIKDKRQSEPPACLFGRENLRDGHSFASAADGANGGGRVCSLFIARVCVRHDPGNRAAMARKAKTHSALDLIEELKEFRFSLGDGNFAHFVSPRMTTIYG
jgi:hypothetical protein